MPHSLVLNLLPASPIPPGYLTGKHLHALFLTLVSSVDRALGDRLHEQKTEKAFTLSPLQVLMSKRVDGGMSKRVDGSMGHRDRNNQKHPPLHSSTPPPLHSFTQTLQWEHKQPIPSGTPCWWRVSLLDDDLFSHLTALWLNLNPAHPWHLGPADLQITSILGTAQSTQPWANFCPYTQLYEQASDDTRQLAFHLCTPATFRQGKYDSALPTRECVFHSLLNRWNRYSGMTFPETLIEYLFPNFFELRTELVNYADGRWAGCVGTISYRILGEADAVAIKQLNTLADFALYAGIGRKTPMGMGMVRRVEG